MALIVYALYIVAIVLFILAGLSVASPPRLNWIGWGLACLTLALLIGAHGPAMPR